MAVAPTAAQRQVRRIRTWSPLAIPMISIIRAALTVTISIMLTACQGPAVRRGQTKVPTELLPLACLTIAVEGRGLPLEFIDFYNLQTKSTTRFSFGKIFDNDHPDYPTAIEGRNKVLCMAIVHLEPGDYIIKYIEFTPTVSDLVATTEFSFTGGHGFRFNIAPGAANYLGTLTFSPDWRAVDSILNRYPRLTGTDQSVHGEFSTCFRIESTQARDKKWAADVIPGMAALPAVLGWLESF